MGEGAGAAVAVGEAGAPEGGLALGAVGGAGAEELVLEVGAGDLLDPVEVAALEEAAGVGAALEGVAVVVGPDAVDGVEDGVAAQGGAAAGGVLDVVVYVGFFGQLRQERERERELRKGGGGWI